MLEEKDLQLIKKIVQEVIVEDVHPHFVVIQKRFDLIDIWFDKFEATMHITA